MMLICVKNQTDLPSFSLLGFPDFTEADSPQLIPEPEVRGHHQGVTVETRKSTAAERREEDTMLSMTGHVEEGKLAGHTFPSPGIPFLLGSH